MGSIINGFNSNLPAQNRIRVKLTHDVNTCDVYFDFDHGTLYWTDDGSEPKVSSTNVAQRGIVSFPYRTQIRVLLVDSSNEEFSAWTPPASFLAFNFDYPATERPSCANGDNDIRRFDGVIYAHSAPLNSKYAATVVNVRDTGTICEDVGIFWSDDKTDPDPCPLDSVCLAPGANLTKALVNYEVLTNLIGRPLWFTAKAASTQSGPGAGCIETFCTPSVNGAAWL